MHIQEGQTYLHSFVQISEIPKAVLGNALYIWLQIS